MIEPAEEIIAEILRKKTRYHMVVQNSMIGAVQKCSDARRAKSRTARRIFHTSSGAVCSATPQMSVFQQPHHSDILFFSSLNLLSASRGDME